MNNNPMLAGLALCLILSTFVSVTSAVRGSVVGVIAFTSFRNGNGEIYRIDSNGENLQNLTNNPAEDMHPIWSPDGTRIVFVSNRDETWGLYQMDVDGGNLQILILSEYEISEPLFSPDGTQISYLSFVMSETPYLMLMSSDGQGTIQLAEAIRNTAWTPDGQFIFAREYWDTILVSINVNDGQLTRFEGMYVGRFSISPDGTQLAYDYGGEFSSITLLDLASGDEIVLPGIFPNSEISDFGAVWSPDGKLIAYVTKMGYGILDVYVTEPDVTTVPRLLFDLEDFHSFNPTWSPDSSQIAFLGAFGEIDENLIADEAFDIYVIDVNSENAINLTNHPARDLEPIWQPATP